MGDDDPIDFFFLPILGIAAVPILLATFSIRRGSMRGLKLLWIFVYLSAVLLCFDGFVGLLMTLSLVGSTRHDQLAGQFLLMATAALTMLWIYLFRTMRSARWLDPNSTPDEWERKMAVGVRRR